MKSLRLKLWQSVGLVIAAGVVPMVAITLGVITVSINKDIDFGRWESFGLAYQRPLQRILDALPRYQAACRPGQPLASREAVGRELEAAFAELATVQRSLGRALQFTETGLQSRQRGAAAATALRAEWESLRAQPPAVAAAGDGVAALVGHVRLAITHLGDTSNLILDPDLDSYYLMDITLCALPQTQERLGRLSAQVHEWIGDGSITVHPAELAALTALLSEADLARIEGDAQTVLNEDPHFYGPSPSLQANLPVAVKAYVEANRPLVELLDRLASGSPPPSMEQFDKTAATARAAAQALWETASGELDLLLDARLTAYRQKRTASLLSIAAALFLSALVSWWFVRRLQRTLRQVASGLAGSARQLVGICAQLSASSQTLASSASEQAASLEETSSSLEELAGASRSNAATAQQVTGLVRAAREAAELGEQEVQGLGTAMADLRASSDDIAKIVRTIDEIAFQTNLLALNAAVEAARAGEAGTGFAVVADEVRSLAQRSAQAARQTAERIEVAIRHAERGVTTSGQVGGVLADIAARVREADRLVHEVATASKEQHQGVELINTAISQMDNATQANAATAEEGASASYELGHEVEALKGAVTALVKLVDGDRGPDPAVTAPARQEPAAAEMPA